MNPLSRALETGRLGAYVVGILGAFLIFAALVWATWRHTQPAPLGEDRNAIRRKALAEVRAVEAQWLENYGWVDKNKGLVHVPIAEAMKWVEREWKNPAQARSNLLARLEKAHPPPPPKPPEQPSAYE